MDTAKLDPWEESARIVEAFASCETDDVAALLDRIAQAIRDRADDS